MKTTIASFFILFALLFSVPATAQIIERGQVLRDLATLDSSTVYEVMLISEERFKCRLFDFSEGEIKIMTEENDLQYLQIAMITSMVEVPGFKFYEEHRNVPNMLASLRVGGYGAHKETRVLKGTIWTAELTAQMRHVYVSACYQGGDNRPSTGGEIWNTRSSNDPGVKIRSATVMGGLYYKFQAVTLRGGAGMGWVSGYYGEYIGSSHTGWFVTHQQYDSYRTVNYEARTIPVELGVSLQLNQYFTIGTEFVHHYGDGYDLQYVDFAIGINF